MPLVDMHSHLLPGIDDGAQSIEESVELIKGMKNMGYQKLITTPHIMQDFYRNTPEIILPLLSKIKEIIKQKGIDIELEVAAEYYLDESLYKKVSSGEKLLTFGDNYFLFETSFMNPAKNMEEFCFIAQSNGYKPILAHPERYIYMHNSFEKYVQLFERGVLFQININSLTGYYSKQVKKIAQKLINKKMVSFLGTDCHNMRHLEQTEKSIALEYFQKLTHQGTLLNDSLL